MSHTLELMTPTQRLLWRRANGWGVYPSALYPGILCHAQGATMKQQRAWAIAADARYAQILREGIR